MSSEISISANSIDKVFPVYDKPHHRLLQMMSSRSAKHRWYREFTALRNISFEVKKGETVGIVGRNGSGKSTLLQIICGTLTPTAGDLQVNGRIAALLELGAGFNPDFTGRENVFLNGTVLGLTRQQIEDRFDDIAAFADIGEFIEQPVKSYSSGMYVRLAFSVAIHVTPDILVVDEALAVGDEAFQRKCFARIEKIRREGATVLFVSHSAGTVLELCNRAILLDRGEMLYSGSPKRTISHYQKMLYAPAERVAAIREEIRESTAAEQPTSVMNKVGGKDAPNVPDAKAVESGATNPSDSASAYDLAWHDDHLLPQSTLRYVRSGAEIKDAHLQTISGERVNVLRPGEEYVYVYDVDFDRAAAGVQFGMLIKTVSGVELGGGVSAPTHAAIEVVEAGERRRAKFRFRCLLAPGTYFLNAGVRGRVDQEETFLDRVVDIAMFRVAPDSDRIATGMVDFDIRSSVANLGHMSV
jgi:lipopolysaccharide transport system ATP-binding protein